jgi:predicted nucleotidyltransferase
MVAEGLVLEQPGGFLLNREHLAAPAVEELTTLYETFLERLRHLVDESDVPVALVGLFGSAARRDGDSTSDIDVLVVSDAPDLEDFVDLLAERIAVWTGNRAQGLTRTPDQLQAMRRANDPIVASWAADLVVVRGDRRLVDRGR